MNKKQAIAIWVFGIVVVLGLLLSEYYIPALVVVGGLVVFGLRTRGKPSSLSATSQVEVAEPTSPNPGLRSFTPHMFASVIVQRMPPNEHPFDKWRPDPNDVPEYADAACELSSHAYQLKVLIDLLTRKFGEHISKLVETSVLSLLDRNDHKFFGPAFEKIDEARKLGPVSFEDIPLGEDLRQDAQVADQMLTLWSDEDRGKLRITLAHCLSLARISADNSFAAMVAKLDFDPSSIAYLKRRDFYAGFRDHWSNSPGSFERQLQRRERNPTFAKEFRQPTQEQILAHIIHER